MEDFIKILLHTHWISWIFHFLIFFILCRWSGIRWPWATILILGIEVWETLDWSFEAPLAWWVRTDTLLDLVAGALGAWAGYAWLHKKENRS